MFEFILAQKLPEQFSGLFAEAQKCYILQDFNRVILYICGNIQAKLLLSELTKNIPEYTGIYVTGAMFDFTIEFVRINI